MALQGLACLDHRKSLRGVDAKCLQHLGRQNLTNRTLERQPPVGRARERRCPRPLGAKIEDPPVLGLHLGEEKPAPIA